MLNELVICNVAVCSHCSHAISQTGHEMSDQKRQTHIENALAFLRIYIHSYIYISLVDFHSPCYKQCIETQRKHGTKVSGAKTNIRYHHMARQANNEQHCNLSFGCSELILDGCFFLMPFFGWTFGHLEQEKHRA